MILNWVFFLVMILSLLNVCYHDHGPTQSLMHYDPARTYFKTKGQSFCREGLIVQTKTGPLRCLFALLRESTQVHGHPLWTSNKSLAAQRDESHLRTPSSRFVLLISLLWVSAATSSVCWNLWLAHTEPSAKRFSCRVSAWTLFWSCEWKICC